MSKHKAPRRRQRATIVVPLFIVIAGALTGGLVVRLMLSPLRPNPAPLANLGVAPWQNAWSRVVSRHVDPQGRVDFTGLTRDPELNAVVKIIAVVDPESFPALFPTTNAHLAYYIDAYNALAMYGVLHAGVPRRFGWFGRVRFFYFQKFHMGGRLISLYSLEDTIIRPMGDPRVHFALNCMSVSCPKLPQSAFTAQDLDSELDTAAHEFVNEDRNVHVDRQKREVTLSAIFNFYIRDFVAKSPSLISYINSYRADRIPADYKVVFADYDWTINDQSRLAQEY